MSGDETNGHCFKNRTSPKATAAITICREAYTIMIIESFRFEDENDARTRFNLKFLRVFLKNIQPGKLYCTIFHLKN